MPINVTPEPAPTLSTVALIEQRTYGTTAYPTLQRSYVDGVGTVVKTEIDPPQAQLDLSQWPDLKAAHDAYVALLEKAAAWVLDHLADPVQKYVPVSPGGLTTTTTKTTATISWATTKGASSYKAYKSSDGGVTWSAAVAVATGTSYQFTGLTANTEYTLAVAAVSSGGEGSKATIVARTQV